MKINKELENFKDKIRKQLSYSHNSSAGVYLELLGRICDIVSDNYYLMGLKTKSKKWYSIQISNSKEYLENLKSMMDSSNSLYSRFKIIKGRMGDESNE